MKEVFDERARDAVFFDALRQADIRRRAALEHSLEEPK
jgi:hypothetical protein